MTTCAVPLQERPPRPPPPDRRSFLKGAAALTAAADAFAPVTHGAVLGPCPGSDPLHGEADDQHEGKRHPAIAVRA